MNSMRRYLFILLWCISLAVSAQDKTDVYRNIYDKAEQDYAIGRIEDVQKALQDNLSDFPSDMLTSVYRLLALCDLSNDQTDHAEWNVRKMLDINPYYTPMMNDPQRFIDMVEQIKSGLSATITTASNQSEKLSEVPVPTTLITEEMIANCGGRNLKEVLEAFVPGMTQIDCNDDLNIAMRGVYSNGQEKMLIMLNGHRLNSYCTNIASPDFSISLEKIKQIEVLRGPASSLYGSVALTAVINIITKQGADVDGIKIKAGGGNHSTFRGDVLWGKRYFDLDILIWGSLYKSGGEEFHFDGNGNNPDALIYKPSGTITVGRVGNKPSYDMGINLKWKDLQFQYNTSFSQIVSPLSMSYFAAPYDIDRYSTYNGIKPSFATQSHHVDLSYGRKVGKLFLQGRVTYDNKDMTHYQVLSDRPEGFLACILLDMPYEMLIQMMGKDGLSRYFNGQEQTFGADFKCDFNYINNDQHKGYLSYGAAFNHFSLDDCRYVLGHSFTDHIPESNSIANIGKDHENSFNSFIQLKHQWNSFILNAGLRYDFKRRYDGSDINEYSPRLAFIFVQPKWNVKLSYSKAFIDAPYLYRKTNEFMTSFTGKANPTLSPETYHAYQLTFGGTQWLKGFDFEINGFLARARDLLYTEIVTHSNTGKTDTYGVELTANYTSRKFTGNLTMTWQKLTRSEIFDYSVNKSFNIPSVTANLTLGWQATKRLKLHSHIAFASSQTAYEIDLNDYFLKKFINSPLAPYIVGQKEFEDYFKKYYKKKHGPAINFIDVPARCIVHAGASYKILPTLELSVNVRNLLNTSYHQSGMGTDLIPQQGRWIMGEISYKF